MSTRRSIFFLKKKKHHTFPGFPCRWCHRNAEPEKVSLREETDHRFVVCAEVHGAKHFVLANGTPSMPASSDGGCGTYGNLRFGGDGALSMPGYVSVGEVFVEWLLRPRWCAVGTGSGSVVELLELSKEMAFPLNLAVWRNTA